MLAGPYQRRRGDTVQPGGSYSLWCGEYVTFGPVSMDKSLLPEQTIMHSRGFTTFGSLLAEYNFRVLHRLGPQHANADTLSRRPFQQCGEAESTGDNTESEKRAQVASTCISTCISSSSSWAPEWNSEQVKSFQNADPALHQIINWLSTRSVTPPTLIVVTKTAFATEGWHPLPSLGGCSRGGHKRLQLVLPPNLVTDVLDTLHNSTTAGHLGVNKTLEKVLS